MAEGCDFRNTLSASLASPYGPHAWVTSWPRVSPCASCEFITNNQWTRQFSVWRFHAGAQPPTIPDKLMRARVRSQSIETAEPFYASIARNRHLYLPSHGIMSLVREAILSESRLSLLIPLVALLSRSVVTLSAISGHRSRATEVAPFLFSRRWFGIRKNK